MLDLPLIPDRICGDCFICCRHLCIDTPEMTKHDGVLCGHCSRGCTIYDTRPQVCRTFHCGWRHFHFDDSWRPDRSGILLVVGYDQAPGGRWDSVRIHLFGKRERILWPPLVAYIGQLLHKNIPLFLTVPGPRGYAAARLFLSSSANVHNAFASNDPRQIAAVMTECVQVCIDFPKEKEVLHNRPVEAG